MWGVCARIGSQSVLAASLFVPHYVRLAKLEHLLYQQKTHNMPDGLQRGVLFLCFALLFVVIVIAIGIVIALVVAWRQIHNNV